MRLCLAQTPADLLTSQARLDWLRASLLEIVAGGADLVLLPELFACGYNIGTAVHDRAEAADGPIFATMAALAAQFDIAIHYGFAERVGAQIFNTAICVSPVGQALCRQRKLAIPPGWESDFFTAGQGCQLFKFKGLKIATLICYDAEFAETVRHVATLGADLVLVPTALGSDWSWVAQTMIPTRAYENGVYLAYANSAGCENGMEFLGASVIAAPNGTEAARARAAPALLFADIDKAQVTKAQARLPYLIDRQALKLT